MQETWVWSLSQEKEMAPHSRNLAWKIPWKEEPGGLQSMGFEMSQRQLSTHPRLAPLLPWMTLFPSLNPVSKMHTCFCVYIQSFASSCCSPGRFHISAYLREWRCFHLFLFFYYELPQVHMGLQNTWRPGIATSGVKASGGTGRKAEGRDHLVGARSRWK